MPARSRLCPQTGDRPISRAGYYGAQPVLGTHELPAPEGLLQTLRRARNISPEQLTAVQDQMAALQSDLANKAQAGDQRAQQALQLIQQSTRW